MVLKVGSFVVKERVLVLGEYSFSTLDRENQHVTNSWPYEDVDAASALEGETDFVVHTPRHRIKKTVFRCHFRMEVLVCLMRLRSQHFAKVPSAAPPPPELQTLVFQSLKCHKNGTQSTCVVEVRPDGIYQRDAEGDVMSHIPYTSLVSIDLICDDHEAVALNHSDNSSLFIVPRRTELAQAINRVMKAYGMQINEYRKKTMEAALKDDGGASSTPSVSFEYQVLKVSQSNESTAAPRTLSVSEKYITEYVDVNTVIVSRPLSRIYALILYQDTLQAFEVVYVDGVRRKYYSAQREKIVCELLSSCRALGNDQVSVEMAETPDWMRMIPRRIISQEGSRIANNAPNMNVMDRELRVAQASILQLLAVHGYRKTARTQRQLPRGLDEEMHSLAVELNVNTPTPGVIAQPNKPFDKVLYVVAREIHDVVNRHGATHDFVSTYLQTLYRLTLAPPAINEFMRILTERGEEYIGTISKVLASKNSVGIYWMFMVLSRLMESKAHKLLCRQLLLSNGLFMVTLLSLFDEDQTGSFMSDLPTMKLCQFVFLLVKANVEKQRKLSETLYQHLATKYRMLLRILFSFPGLATVEACVGILSRMTKNPAFLHFGNMGSPLRSNDGQIPRQTLIFGETLNFGPSSQRGTAVAPVRSSTFSSRRNIFASSRNTFSSSGSSSSGGSGNGVVVQNPEILLRQYRQFLEAACGSLKMGIDQYDDPVFLRLRYRCRNIFLQELMSHLVGNFDEFKRSYSVECFQFSGFIGMKDGQREKTTLYLTPRALISVQLLSRYTHEFEYRSIEGITQATAYPDAFVITTKKKPKYIYSDSSNEIVDKIKSLAGIIGIHLRSTTRDKLPKPLTEKQLNHGPFESNDVFDVQKRTGRHGSTRLRKKKLCFIDGSIIEVAGNSKKLYDLRNLRRVVIPGVESGDTQAVVALEFSDSSRAVYVPYDIDKFLAALYDGYRYVNNFDVSLSREFPKLNPKMSPRALLKDEHERFLYLNQDGLYVPAHAALEKEIEGMNGEGVSVTSATNRVTFALESLNMNVEVEDFAGKTMKGRLEKLGFGALLRGMNVLLEHSCKPPIRASEICVILETFCRINDGCYRIAMEQSNGGAMILVPTLAQILVSGDPIATVWAVNAFHSLIADKSRSNAHRAAEKAIRYQVFEHKKLISLLAGLLDQHNPSSTFVMLQLVLDVLVVSRHSTDNNHFDAIVKALGGKYQLLLGLVSQDVTAGLSAAVVCTLKVIVDHGDHRVRKRICDVALDSGLTVNHLHKAFFHPSDNARETYQYVASIWVTHHKPSHDMLVRILPQGFIRMISSPMVRKLLKKQRARQTESMRRKSKVQSQGQIDGSEWFIRRMQLQIGTLFASGSVKEARVKEDPSRMNYPGESSTDMALLSSMVGKDFLLPDLIWNEQTRNELKAALEMTIKEFNEYKANQAAALSLVVSRKAKTEPTWNHAQFAVRYESISRELQVDGFYLRVITERITDGSLQLAEVAKIVHAMEAGTPYRGKLKKSSSLFFASMDIARNPGKFFNEVYQCWLEYLYLNGIPLSGTSDWSASGSNGFSLFSGREGSAQHGHSMLKILIELANVFPEARPMTRHRARFLTELLQNSYQVTEIQDIVELMSAVSLSGEACAELCTKVHIQVLLFMSLLSHRRQISTGSGAEIDHADIPMMDLQPMSNDTSSFPIAELSLYDDTRFSLRWSVKLDAMNEIEADSVTGGPFSANELKEYLDSSPFIRQHQINALYVCCCSEHQASGGEHTWKSIFEYPELRWMELTDEPIDPVCATFALKTLRNFMVKDQLTASFGTKNVWPPPLVNTLVANSSSLASMVQLLLVNDPYVRRYVCEILLSLGDEGLAGLYQYGVFYFALSTIVRSAVADKVPEFVPEANLLKRIHRIQRSPERRNGQSYLTDILPESLITILDSETPEHFANVYSGREKDKRVLWSTAMRGHLQEMLDEHLRGFKESLRKSVSARYGYTPIPPISYAELSGDVYISGFYLSTFNHSDADVEEVEDPVFLMKSIEEKWRLLVRRQVDGVEKDMDHSDAFRIFGWSEDTSYTSSRLRARYRELCQQNLEINAVRNAYDSLSGLLEQRDKADGGKTSDEIIECILKAQLQLLEKFSPQFFSFESSTLDLLTRVLATRSSVDNDQQGNSKFCSLAMRVLYQLLTVAPQNGPLLLNVDGSWSVVLDLVEVYAFGHDIVAKETMFAILQVLLESEEGVQSLMGDNRASISEVPPSKAFDFDAMADDDDTSFFTATEYMSQNGTGKFTQAQRVYSLLDDVILSFTNIQPWHIQKMSFDIASALCQNAELQEQIMTSSRVFWKGLYLILASAENSSGIEASQESVTKLEKQERDMLESAFGALRSLALGSNGDSRSAGLDALANLLPMDFLACLEKPNGHDFCTILLSDICEPTCIWNDNTRYELSQLTEEFCTDPNGDGQSFLESASRYSYDCLKTEPSVGGIYLSVLLDKSESDPQAITEEMLYPATAVDFIESLLMFLNENRNPKLAIYSDTLPALDCLSLLCDIPAFRPAIVECLEQHGDDEDAVNASISVATFGRYLLPFDGDDKAKAVSISSRRSLSTYGFRIGAAKDAGDAPPGMEAEFGNVDYLSRQELALLILNKICGFECNLERMLAPFCQFTWCLQVITDHLGYEQGFYALSCLAELCDTCLVVAQYVEMSGLWVEILGIALQSRQHVLHEQFLKAEALREPAFEVLYAVLMKDFTLRERMYSNLCRFLPYPIVYQIHLDPSKATRFFDDNHEKSDLIWNSHKRTEVRKKLDEIICRNRMERSVAKRDSVLLDDETDVIRFPNNFVAGLYIDRFLSRPDPEKLTNPAYNLELLFQLWRTKLELLMSFDLQNPPDTLKSTADEIDKYTMAMTHILRASLDIDESIANNRMPEQIVKLIRYCNQNLVTSFPYRCILRIARRMVQFPEIIAKEFVELLICRITMQHPDIPSLLKLLRRVLEARNTALAENGTKDDPDYWLKDLKYYPQMLAFLEGLVENKEQIEAPLLSNVNRVLRIIHAEEPKETHLKQISRSFMGRWHNFTLESRQSITNRGSITAGHSDARKSVDTKSKPSASPDVMSVQSFDVDGAREVATATDVASTQSFDVDGERDPSIRIDLGGEVDDREVDIDDIPKPPKSINFAGGTVEVADAVAPRSFRYKGETVSHSPLPSPTAVRYSTLGARYEPIDSQYHSRKAAEYDEDEEDLDIIASRPRRGSLPSKPDSVDTVTNGLRSNGGAIPTSTINYNYPPSTNTQQPSQATDATIPSDVTSYMSRQSGLHSERRYSLLDSWKAPTSAAPNSSLTTLTISRRGRRAAAVYSRRKSKAPKRWFG